MSSETLELSPHELYFLPPGTPATAPATRVEVEVDGEMRVFLARLELSDHLGKYDQYHVFSRLENVKDAPILASHTLILANHDPTSDAVTHIRQTMDTGFIRFWHPPDAAFGLAVSTENYGRVEWRNNDTRVKVENFAWEIKWTDSEFASLPQFNFIEICQRAYGDENSFLRGALRWNALPNNEKDRIAFGCENGDWNILRRLFGCAQIIIFDKCGPFPHLRKSNSRWFFDEQWQEKQLNSPARRWAMRWRTAICQIVRPNFWIEEPIYVYNWRHSHSDYARCRVECSAPTAHEFLEAQLELRDFLRPHLSADEIEALMRL